ncbi:hypothetical protein [Mycolicibacterium llatzerense]|uniref:hypothetical protein n=1 Tax=Mycolicibacterium llatzerense TaxID=280871 RepID=UPI0021B5E269|nr:hypothetical protein [Mycolicibacterium llatzerense]
MRDVEDGLIDVVERRLDARDLGFIGDAGLNEVDEFRSGVVEFNDASTKGGVVHYEVTKIPVG